MKVLAEEHVVQELPSFRSSEACLFAFFTSAFVSTLGAKPSIALPRLMALLPVVFALSASNPPGMSRFFAMCAAATHWPMFLKPPHAVCASWPVSVLILPAIAVLWLRTVLGEACDMSVWVAAPFSCDSLMLEPLPFPCPEDIPPAGLGCER